MAAERIHVAYHPTPALLDLDCREQPEGEPYVTDRAPLRAVPLSHPAPLAHPAPHADPARGAHPAPLARPTPHVHRAPLADPAPGAHPIPRAHPEPVAPPAYPVERTFLQADRVALSLRGALERTTVPLARAAAAIVAARGWCELGFARLDDYARERLGRSGRWVRDLAALGERLPSLPRLAAALTGEDDGRPLGRVAATLLAEVATPSSLDDWIARARALSIRALRDSVRAARAAAPAASSAATEGSPVDASVPPVAAARDADCPGREADCPARDADDDDPADRLLVRMTVPTPVLAAFDEALDLFRAVEGGEATVASFVEVLIAEAAARGPGEVPDADALALSGADMRVLRAGPQVAATERALATSTRNWRHLPEHVESSWALSLAGVALARFKALAEEAGRGGAADLDRQLRALVGIENEIEARLGGILADLAERRAWPRLRFAGVGHYGEERLGLSRTVAEDRARLARDLRRHPRLGDAYAAGRLGREAAALVARLLRDAPADPVREAAWLARAQESTIKRMRDEARALGRYRALGPRATAPDTSAPAHHRQALDAHPTHQPHAADSHPTDHHQAPAPLDDAEWHASLRRDPGLARRRVRLFGNLTLSSPDVFQALPSSPDVFQSLPHEADAALPHEAGAYLRLRLPLDLGHQLMETVEAERRRLSAAADALPWDWDEEAADGRSPSWLAARMFSIRCRRLPSWVGLLALLEDFVDTWDDPAAMPRRPGDEIYVRDGWRCVAPGCTSRRNLEVHHVRYRSRGGDDDPANRICLCRFHHQRGEHGDLASCRGRAPTGVTWRLGRRDAPSWYRNERLITARE